MGGAQRFLPVPDETMIPPVPDETMISPVPDVTMIPPVPDERPIIIPWWFRWTLTKVNEC